MAIVAGPRVMPGAGDGFTAMLSMRREVVYEGKRVRRMRPTWFFKSARRLVDLAFREEVDTLNSWLAIRSPPCGSSAGRSRL